MALGSETTNDNTTTTKATTTTTERLLLAIVQNTKHPYKVERSTSEDLLFDTEVHYSEEDYNKAWAEYYAALDAYDRSNYAIPTYSGSGYAAASTTTTTTEATTTTTTAATTTTTPTTTTTTAAPLFNNPLLKLVPPSVGFVAGMLLTAALQGWVLALDGGGFAGAGIFTSIRQRRDSGYV